MPEPTTPGGASVSRAHLSPLRDRDVRLLLAGRCTAFLGTGMAPTALAFGVLELPGGGASALGLVLAVAALGQAVGLLPGGVAADRWGRRRIMVAAELLAATGAFISSMLFLASAASVPALAVLAGIAGVAGAFFIPAFTGFVPEVAGDDDLQSVNVLLRLVSNSARIIGTALGGLVVSFFGPGPALFVNGIALATAALLVSVVRVRRPSSPGGNRQGPLHDLREGWREFRARRWVVGVVVLGAVSNLGLTATLGVLGPLRAQTSLGGPAAWGLIASAFALGTIPGALIALRLRPAHPLQVAMAVLGLAGLPVAALASPWPTFAIATLAFLAGAGLDVFTVLWDTALQQNIPTGSLSRVSAFDWLGSFALNPVSFALCGPLVEGLGLTSTLWLAAGLAVTPPLTLLDPQVRQLRAGRRESLG